MIATSRIAVATLSLTCAAMYPPSSGATESVPPPPIAENVPGNVPTEPNPGFAAMERAKDAFKRGVWQEALDAAAIVLETEPKNPEALYVAGTSERLMHRVADAERHLGALIEASPRFPLAHFQLGFALFVEADEFEREGQTEKAQAEFSEAAEQFGEELGRDPTHADSLSSRAIALARAGQIDESVEAHAAWIASARRKSAPVTSLAATYALAGRSSDAMRALDQLPDTNPIAVSAAVLAVAKVFGARNDWGAAVPFLERAVASDSTSTEARALLTEGYARGGVADETASSLRLLLSMGPTPDQAERVGEAIKASLGNGASAPSVPGVEPPAILRNPSPRYPKGQESNVETVVRVLTLVGRDGAVVDTVLVPNRIWKDIRESGFEAAALDAVKHARFGAGTKDGQLAALWVVVAVKFDGA
jgi:tetratricopeptide (TPR) repeat protein